MVSVWILFNFLKLFYNLFNFHSIFFADIVFFIFLYQRWIYKVDITRVNEFGFSGEMENQPKPEGEQLAIEDNAQTSSKKKTN